MTKYFRITAYNKKLDTSIIMDANGMFDQLWKFSAYLMEKGFDIISASDENYFIDYNISKAEFDTEHVILRANCNGKPENITQTIDDINYKAIKVGEKIYIPRKEERI